MTRMIPRWWLTPLLGLCLLFTGCPAKPTPPTGTAAEDTTAPLLEPFTPPSLAELDAQAKWFSQPVEDGLELLRKYRAENPPQTSTAEALALENKTPDDNKRILDGLGQLPANDSEVDWEATLNQHTPMNVNGLNPLLASSVGDIDVLSLTGLGLTTIDWTMRPFADKSVVKTWQTSEDRLYDKFVIRDDLTWTDGTPVTAHDFAYSFQAIMNPKVPAAAVRSGPDQLKWVHAYDDHTVVIFHKESLATNVGNVSFPIIPRHIFEKSIAEDPTLTTSPVHVKFEANPVTAGPYRIAKFERDKEVVMERREEWYMQAGKQIRDKPNFKTVRLKIIQDDNTALLALKNGDIDTLELRPEPWMTQTNDQSFYKSHTKSFGTEWSHSYIGWNLGRPFFSDVRVRQAMSYAINHEEMIKNICYNLYEPGQGIYHPTAWMAPNPMPAPYQQDLVKAEELLEQAGWTDEDGDGILDKEIDGQRVKFEFALQFGSGSKVAERICGMVAENLKQIGVSCIVKPTEFTVLQADAKKHDFDAMCAGWGSGADPDDSDNLWTTKALKTGGRNYVQYSNPVVDKLFEDGKREFDRAKRAEIYRQIALTLWEDQPYTWLYYRSSMYAFSKNLRGYMYSPRGPFHYSPGIGSIWKAK
jgi:peptide/nickel transport system substrate-binding protein